MLIKQGNPTSFTLFNTHAIHDIYENTSIVRDFVHKVRFTRYFVQSDYLIFVKGLYTIVNTQVECIRSGFHPGLTSDFYFWEETKVEDHVCSDGLDRYGLCMFICDYIEEKRRNVIKVQYPDYPW